MTDDFYYIPDDVWEGRCRWCIHRQTEENRPVPKIWTLRNSYNDRVPCRILGITRPGEIEGECKSFSPNYIYGICWTCRFDNSFHDGFCTRDGKPNKRQVYIGQGYSKEAYWGVHRLSTCDAYRPDGELVDIMRRQAAKGKIPRNFNPDTMEPVGEGFEETKAAIRAWEDIDRVFAADRERMAAEKAKRIAEEVAKASGQVAGQIAMDLTGGQNG